MCVVNVCFLMLLFVCFVLDMGAVCLVFRGFVVVTAVVLYCFLEGL